MSYQNMGLGGSDGAYARNQEQFVDLEAEKPLRTQQQHGYQDDFVPTAQAVGSNSWTNDSIPVARAIEDMEVEIRHGFVRKVFGILFVQLAFTFGFVLLASYHHGVRLYMRDNGWPVALGIALSFGAIFGMICFIDMVRSYPGNYMLLAVFTFAETLILGSVSAASDPDVIALAVGTTVGVVFALVLFAMQTRHDFTGIGPYLFVALWTMILYSFIASLFGIPPGGLYSLMGTLLFSMYIVYDVQLVMGGKHRRFQLGVDEYCFAALNIYLDIINLFLYILDLLNRSQR